MAIRIQIEALHKQFGEFIALRNFTEAVAAGDRIALLGHNGAGKSTLLNILATLTRPTQGTIDYFKDDQRLPKKLDIRDHLGYLSHQSMQYADLTALENLRFWARVYGADTSETKLMARLESVGMNHAAHRLFRECSRGMQQRISIARSLLSEPDLLLLDEPFAGLDADGRERLSIILREQVPSWLLVTHDWSLGYELAERFWILHRGRLIRAANKQDLSKAELLEYAANPKQKVRA